MLPICQATGVACHWTLNRKADLLQICTGMGT